MSQDVNESSKIATGKAFCERKFSLRADRECVRHVLILKFGPSEFRAVMRKY